MTAQNTHSRVKDSQGLSIEVSLKSVTALTMLTASHNTLPSEHTSGLPMQPSSVKTESVRVHARISRGVSPPGARRFQCGLLCTSCQAEPMCFLWSYILWSLKFRTTLHDHITGPRAGRIAAPPKHLETHNTPPPDPPPPTMVGGHWCTTWSQLMHSPSPQLYITAHKLDGFDVPHISVRYLFSKPGLETTMHNCPRFRGRDVSAYYCNVLSGIAR